MRRNLFGTVTAAAVLLTACGGSSTGGDGGSDVDGAGANADPELILGGGVSSGAIDGVLHVHAIDDGTDARLPGATVYVAGLQETTDDRGLASFHDGSLRGAQTITVVAGGYAQTTWIGANGANVTVPLRRSPTVIPQARVEGTIDGWDGLPAPDFGEYNLAIVLYSFTTEFGAPENAIAQPMSGDAPLNICLRTPLSNPPCNWQMNTRTGWQAHFAVIVRGDDKGTPSDPNDDTHELLGFALKTEQTPMAGETLTGQTLSMIDISGFANASVTFPGAPTGAQTRRVMIPFVDLGYQGQLPIPVPTLTPSDTTTPVPSLTGPFAGAHHNVVALALPDGNADRPFSATFARDVDVASTISIPEWLPPPSQLQATGGTYSFAGAADASAHAVTFVDAADRVVWSVTILDDSASFTVPTGAPDPLPSGGVEMRITAFLIPGFDPQEFSLDTFAHDLVAVSDDAIVFNR